MTFLEALHMRLRLVWVALTSPPERMHYIQTTAGDAVHSALVQHARYGPNAKVLLVTDRMLPPEQVARLKQDFDTFLRSDQRCVGVLMGGIRLVILEDSADFTQPRPGSRPPR